MIEYFLKLKNLSDNLAIAGEPVSERDRILQLLRGLGLEYNPIVASLTAKEDDLPVQSVQSILLKHEHQPCPSFPPTRGRHHGRGHSSRSSISQPQCQLCGKFGHGATNSFPMTRPPILQESGQAMLGSGSVPPSEEWIMDPGATHHLTNTPHTLPNSRPSLSSISVAMGNGKLLPVSHVGLASFHSPSSFHLPGLTSNLLVLLSFVKIHHPMLNFILLIFLSRIVIHRRFCSKAPMIRISTNSQLILSLFPISSGHLKSSMLDLILILICGIKGLVIQPNLC